jgi:hypothetical protein
MKKKKEKKKPRGWIITKIKSKYFFSDKYKISPYNWPKLQIAPCSLKIRLNTFIPPCGLKILFFCPL